MSDTAKEYWYRPLTEELFEDVRGAYEDDLTPMIEIASWLHVSRTAIYKFLKKHGVNTSKSVRVIVKCANCGKDVPLRRAVAREKRKVKAKVYCNKDCYFADVNGDTEYIPWRHGGRIARDLVSKYFDLQPEHVVHHEDRSQRNNEIDNFRVFANQSDHLKYHRGADKPEPVWDGSKV
jgi:hypothetical protein